MLDDVLITESFLRNAMPAQSGKPKRTVEFEKFISQHECPINHTASARSVKAKGVVECFQSSLKIENWGILNSLRMETLKHTHQLLQLTYIQE